MQLEILDNTIYIITEHGEIEGTLLKSNSEFFEFSPSWFENEKVEAWYNDNWETIDDYFHNY